jgi:hypothetical protein
MSAIATAKPCAGTAGSGKSRRTPRRSRPCAAIVSTLTLCQSPAGSDCLDPLQAGPQLFLQPGGADVAAARQSADHYLLRSLQSVHQPAGDVAQPAGQPMPLHSRAHRPGNDQSHLGRAGSHPIAASRIDDQVWLHGSGAVFDRVTKVRRPRQAVPRGKHPLYTGIGITRSASGAPCGAGLIRSRVPPGCASAAGSRARGLGAGCSAGRSACPLPRLSPRCIWHRFPARSETGWNTVALTKPWQALCLAGNRRGPRCKLRGSQPYRRLSGDCTRVRSSVRRVKPGPLGRQYGGVI